MTHEEKKAAVLAECERLCPEDNSIHDFSEHLFLKCKKSGDQAAWWDCVAIEYQNFKPVFTVSTVGITNDCNFEIAYRLLGLDKPPADTRWERLKAELAARNEAEKQSIRDNEPLGGYPAMAKDIAYAKGCVYGWIEGTMERIEKGEL